MRGVEEGFLEGFCKVRCEKGRGVGSDGSREKEDEG